MTPEREKKLAALAVLIFSLAIGALVVSSVLPDLAAWLAREITQP